jgi:protein-disulfide isomerase
MAKEETITLNKSTIWKITTFVFAILFVISWATGGFGTGNDSMVQAPTAAAPQPSAPAAPTIVKQKFDDDGAMKGDPDAKVRIIEFSDFECPFCGRFYEQTLPQLTKEYIDTGKVNIVYKDFPLPFHASATKAAIASECAEEQGKFWEYHDALFEGQANWANIGPTASVPIFKEYAKDLGLKEKDFNTCLDTDKYADEVKEDTAESGGAVSGTPTFFIGNDKDGYTVLVGAQPFSAFKQVIDAAL